MRVVLYAATVWLVASVPAALFVARLCRACGDAGTGAAAGHLQAVSFADPR